MGILECYVLWSIGELTSADEAKLNEMAPKLQKVYGIQGKWHEIIASVMRFPPDMAEKIAKLWKRNRALGEANGENLMPQDFAEMFVDQNLAA